MVTPDGPLRSTHVAVGIFETGFEVGGVCQTIKRFLAYTVFHCLTGRISCVFI